MTDHRKSTGSAQAIPLKPHSFLKAKTHTIPSRLCCHTAHTRAHLISCVGGATPPHCNHIHFTPSSPPVRPYSTLDHTGVHCLINWHALTFDLLPRPRKHLAGSKVTPNRGYAHPLPGSGLSLHWRSRHATPNRRQ
jgi:hypothetical protein